MQRSEAYLQHFELFEVFECRFRVFYLGKISIENFRASFFRFITALNYYILTI